MAERLSPIRRKPESGPTPERIPDNRIPAGDVLFPPVWKRYALAKVQIGTDFLIVEGTATLLDFNFAVTAAHEIADLSKGELRPGPILLHFSWGPVKAGVKWYDIALDAALLEILEGQIPDDVRVPAVDSASRLASTS